LDMEQILGAIIQEDYLTKKVSQAKVSSLVLVVTSNILAIFFTHRILSWLLE